MAMASLLGYALLVLPVGGFSSAAGWNGTVLVARGDAPVFASFSSQEAIGTVQGGWAVVVAGPPQQVGGREMAPIMPRGVVHVGAFSAREAPDPARRLAGSTHAENNATGCGAGHGGDHEGDHAQHEILVFIFTIVLLGTAILHLTTLPMFESLQFTVVVFIIGILFALVAESGALDSTGFVLRSYQQGTTMDPHLILFIFLPPLLAGDAMTIDTYVAKHRAGQCLLLAGPGVAIGALLTALVIYVLPYGWDFPMCVTMGSILAATDPVAVVSLLKELGASPGLTILIQGESLLNDGTAIVLFMIAYDIVGGAVYTTEDVLVFIAKNVIGAPLCGGIIGVLGYLWIRSASDKLCHSNPLIQISLTIACAYWSFVLAEGLFHISGVLSTVVSSLVLAEKMWPALVDRTAMLEIWHVVENIGNALVFTLAGLLTGQAIMKTVTAGLLDVACAFVMYFAVTVIRFAMLVCFRPLLSRLGQQVTFEESLVVTWGALRGMVGLALAILVKQDRANGSLSEGDGQRALFLVGSIVTFTLVVNATTTSKLCNFLGILQASEGRNALLKNIVMRASGNVRRKLDTLGHSSRVYGVSMDRLREGLDRVIHAVEHHLPGHGEAEAQAPGQPKGDVRVQIWTVPPDADAGELLGRYDAAKAAMLNACEAIRRFQFGGQFDDIKKLLLSQGTDPGRLKVAREVFLDVVREDYWRQMEAGAFLVGSPEFGILTGSINVALDRCGTGLSDWEHVKHDLHFESFSTGLKAQRPQAGGAAGGFGKADTWASLDSEPRKPFHRRKYDQWQMYLKIKRQACAIHMIEAFIQAHTHAQSEIATYFGDDADVDSPEEAFVIIESEIQVLAAMVVTAKFDPKVMKRINTMWEARRLSEGFRQDVLRAHGCGVLRTREAQSVLHPLAHAMRTLNLERKKLSRTMTDAHFERRISGMSEDEAAFRIQHWWRSRIMGQHLNASITPRRAQDTPLEI